MIDKPEIPDSKQLQFSLFFYNRCVSPFQSNKLSSLFQVEERHREGKVCPAELIPAAAAPGLGAAPAAAAEALEWYAASEAEGYHAEFDEDVDGCVAAFGAKTFKLFCSLDLLQPNLEHNVLIILIHINDLNLVH